MDYYRFKAQNDKEDNSRITTIPKKAVCVSPFKCEFSARNGD